MREPKAITLEDTKEALLKWAKSCETQEQLDLLKDVVDEFLVSRFAKTGEKSEVLNALIHVNAAISEQEKLVTVL